MVKIKRKNQQAITIALIAIAIIASVAFMQGGLFSVLSTQTGLTSGDTLTLINELDGVQDQYFTGTIATLNNSAQEFIISQEAIPTEYTPTKNATLLIEPLQVEQRASIINEVPLHQLIPYKIGYNDGTSTTRSCIPTLDYLDTQRPNVNFWDGFTPYSHRVRTSNGYYICYYHYIEDRGVTGTIGMISNDSTIVASQIIQLNGIDEWVLRTSNDLSAKTQNGRVTNIGSQGKLEPIPVEGIWMYQEPNTFNNYEAYNIRQNSNEYLEFWTQLQDYEALIEDIEANPFSQGNYHLYADGVNREQEAIVNAVLSASTTATIDNSIESVRNVGDEVILQQRITDGSEYEVTLNADLLGIRTTGYVCSFSNVPESVEFSEDEQGILSYTITNTGQDPANVAIRTTCAGLTISSNSKTHTLGIGESVTDKLLVSRQVSGTANLEGVCTLSCTGVQSGDGGTPAQVEYDLVVTPLQNCNEGDTSAPLLENDEIVVYVYGDSCEVIDEVRCDGSVGIVDTSDGYVCADDPVLDQDSGGSSPPPITGDVIDQGAGSTPVSLFIVIIGLMGVVGVGVLVWRLRK